MYLAVHSYSVYRPKTILNQVVLYLPSCTLLFCLPPQTIFNLVVLYVPSCTLLFCLPPPPTILNRWFFMYLAVHSYSVYCPKTIFNQVVLFVPSCTLLFCLPPQNHIKPGVSLCTQLYTPIVYRPKTILNQVILYVPRCTLLFSLPPPPIILNQVVLYVPSCTQSKIYGNGHLDRRSNQCDITGSYDFTRNIRFNIKNSKQFCSLLQLFSLNVQLIYLSFI